MELMLVGEMLFEVAASSEDLWTERAMVSSGESTEESMEVKVSKRSGDELTVFAVEGRKVAMVHPGVLERLNEVLVECEGRCGLFDLASSCGVSCMFVNEVCLEVVSVFERLGTEETIVTRLVLAGVSVVMGPTRFSGDE
jgi:hypothetical protein